MLDLDAAEALCAAADVWVWMDNNGMPFSVCRQTFQPTVAPRGRMIGHGEWICMSAAARTLLPEALREIRKLRGQVETLLRTMVKDDEELRALRKVAQAASVRVEWCPNWYRDEPPCGSCPDCELKAALATWEGEP